MTHGGTDHHQLASTQTAELAEFAATVSFDDLPASTVTHAKRCVLDTLGCGLYGSALPWTRILAETLQDVSGAGSARVWGASARLSPDAATLVNGTAVHSFELDDLHKTAIMHPGGVTLPGILGLVDGGRSTSGRDLLTALVVGYEVGIRVGLAVGLGLLHRGWHNNGVLGAFSAAAGAGRLLGLDPRQMEHALGIAASQASGLMAAQYGSMVKRFHAGRAAQSGLYSATLAKRDFTGTLDVFTDRYGMFLPTFADKYDASLLTYQLGTGWEIENVGFKWYPACGSSHTSIDAVLAVRARHVIDPRTVVRCSVDSSTATQDHVGWRYAPDTVTTAQMNLPYAVAVALTHGEVTVDHFAPEHLADPDLVRLAGLVDVRAAADIDERGPRFRHAIRMRLELDDGTVLEEAVDHAKGSEYVPLTDQEVRVKFRRLAGRTLGADRTAEVEAAIDALDTAPDAAELSARLSVPYATDRT